MANRIGAPGGLEIEALAQAFESGTLPRERWNHATHLTVALWYLKHHSRDEATRRLRDAIQRYNRQSGSGIAYHETMTLAWIAIIARFLSHVDRGQSIADLAEHLTRNLCNKHLLSFFYSRERLMSEEARRSWLPPDLHPIEDPAVPGSMDQTLGPSARVTVHDSAVTPHPNPPPQGGGRSVGDCSLPLDGGGWGWG